MVHNRGLVAAISAVVIAVALCAMAQNGLGATMGLAALQSDEAILRKLVEQFYDASSKKDLSSLMNLASGASEAMSDHKGELENLFATKDLSFSNLTMSRVSVEVDKASIRAAIDVSLTDRETKENSKTRLIRTFQFIKQDGNWKFWDYGSAVDELAEKLAAAKPGERTAILAAERELMTVELRQGLISRGSNLENQQKFNEAAELYELARQTAEQINDQAGIAFALMSLGNISRAQSNYARAIENYRKALTYFEAIGNRLGALNTLDNLAQAYVAQRNFAAALDIYQKVFKESEASGSKTEMANSMEAIGVVHYEKGDYDSAMDAFNKSVAFREASGDSTGEENTLANIGNLYLLQERYDLALKQYLRALPRLEASNDRARTVGVLNSIAKTYYIQRNYNAAIEYYRKVLTNYKAPEDNRGIASTLEDIANVYKDLGNFKSALEYFQKSLALCETMNFKAGMAGVLNAIGAVYYQQKEYDQALGFYEKGLKLFEGLSEKMAVVGVLQNIANVYYSRADYDTAIEYYQKSVTLAETLNDKPGRSNALLGIGLAHSWRGNYEGALDYYNRSLKIEQELGKKANVASVLHNIGLVYAAQGNQSLALANYFKSLSLDRDLRNKRGVATTMASIGNVHSSLGNYALALDYNQQGLAIVEELNDKGGVSRALASIGGVYYLQGDYDAALKFFQRSLSLWEELTDKAGVAGAHAAIGNAYLGQKNYLQALDHYQRSLALQEALGNQEAMGYVFAGIGNVQYAQSDYEKALASTERAATIGTQIGNLEILWYSQFKAGNVYLQLGQSSQAQRAFETAISTVETINAQSSENLNQARFLEGKANAYLGMVELLVGLNKPYEAFAYAERAKRQALLDIIAAGRIRITRDMTSQEKETEGKLIGELVSGGTQIYRERLQRQPDVSRLNGLAASLKRARAEYEAFEVKLYTAHNDLQTYRGRFKPFSVAEVSALLPDAKSAVLEYAVTGNAVYLFVLTRATASAAADGATEARRQPAVDIRVYPLNVKKKDLEAHVSRFREMLLGRDEQLAQPAQELYNLLVEPAKEQLIGKTRLLVVPDSVLWGLPLHALQNSDGRFLIEEIAVSYAPSLSVLQEMRRPQRARAASTTAVAATLIAFGNSTLSGETIERVKLVQGEKKIEALPETEKEVRALGQIYGAGQSKVYTATQASEDRVKSEAGKFRVLHLATRATIDDLNPMYSNILLSQSGGNKKEDGLLESWEVLGMDLQSEVAVISAAEAHQVNQRAGAGFTGFTWALFVAGCPSTVVSQWQAPAGDLMLGFHKNLKPILEDAKSQETIAEALRQAVLKMISGKTYRHPFYWAGFFIIGEPDVRR